MFGVEVSGVFDGVAYSGGGAVVVVEGERVVEVLPGGAEVACEVVRYPGATLLPGLIDVHVHLCCDGGPGALDRIPECSDGEMVAVIENSLAAQLAAGVTAVRDLGDRSWAVVDWQDRADVYPTVVASGPPITTPLGHCWNMGGAVSGLDELRRAVDERAHRGADLVKIMASGGVNTPGTDPAAVQFSAEELTAVVSEARAVGLPVVAHAHSLQSIKNALAAGVDGIEHCSFLTGDSIDVAERVVGELVSSRTTVCPTLGIKPGAVPPPAVQEMLRRTGTDLESRNRLAAKLHHAGVRLVSGSDGGISPGKPHGLLPESVIAMVNGGIPTPAALASATSLAAATCGLGETHGRILPTYTANFLLVPGNPLADITTLRTPLAIYLRGRLV
ncbi:amidohydrolase family protein [Kribbella sp. NPDC006257]|uniref:amidohydrolase family protein n=1 Tax=Kribbella sp. NPDC006257 TaxID=3156738 RepID=UPI0033A9097B